MYNITGFFDQNGQYNNLDYYLNQMIYSLVHRGPDDQDISMILTNNDWHKKKACLHNI